MSAPPPLIANVSDTARWVAFYRAMETERPDAIFRDPFARRLAGARGEAMVRELPKGRQMAWPMIVRTALIDEMVMTLTHEKGVDCVLNLAAGLDARPWRLPLPPTLHWVDVDHEAMVEYKNKEMEREQTVCSYEAIGLDLADSTGRKAVLTRINAGSACVLVITEGLLVYLEAAAVAGLASDLAAQPAFRYWITDLASPGLLKMLAKNWQPTLQAANAPFRFGPAENTGFFAPFGWREVEWRSLMEESFRLKRTMRMAGFWRFIGRFFPKHRREEFKRFSGIALLEKQSP